MCSHICTVSSNSEFHHAPSRVDRINCIQASMEDEITHTHTHTHTQYVALHHAANNDIGTEQFTTM
jgi:hypothetical protein